MTTNKNESAVSSGIRNSLDALKEGKPLIKKLNPPEFTIKIANNLEERESAFQLAYHAYLEKGFITENLQKWCVQGYDAKPETIILIVQDKNKKLAGTLTLVFDESTKLPAEKIYYEEIKQLRAKNEKLVEISRLAISHEYRNSKEVMLLLINYLMIFSHYVKKYTSLIIEVNPRHKNYYKVLLSFDEVGKEKACPMVLNAPAILLYLSLNKYQAEVRCRTNSIEQGRRDRSLYSYYLKPEQELLVAHYLKNQIKPISPEEKIYFGISESGICRTINI
jgi:hypothetical protein